MDSEELHDAGYDLEGLIMLIDHLLYAISKSKSKEGLLLKNHLEAVRADLESYATTQ